MLTVVVGLAIVMGALALFAWLGLTAPRSADAEDYLVARSSQSGLSLGLSFLASGLGAWILFAVPEIGAGLGFDGVLGYTIAGAAPLLVMGAVGPRLRRLLPEGHSLGEVAQYRFGTTLHFCVSAVSILYMLTFLAAELTAAGSVAGVLADIDSRIVVLLLAAGTLAYTTVGGLRASLRTDRWQAWLIVSLLALAMVALGFSMDSPGSAIVNSGLMGLDRVGVEAAVTLTIAVISANLFHQGYWQRVWSAADDRALRRGTAIGALGSVPVILLVGFAGIAAAGSGLDLGSPPVPFFALLSQAGNGIAAVVLFLGVALVASSVDTLESGLAAIVAPATKNHLGRARVATALFVVPAVIVALQGLSVLRLLLVADLLATAIVIPALAVLWPRATSAGAVAGCIGGLIGAVVIPALTASGSLGVRFANVTFAGGVPVLPPFLWALTVSGIATVAVSLAGPGPQTVARSAPSSSAGTGTEAQRKT